jgi:cytochrome c553
MNKLALTATVLVLGCSAAYAGGNPDAGKEKSRPCAACHGADGNSATPDFPKLAGQHSDYLVKALKDYKSGKRKNPIMGPQAAPLSLRDMEDLAAYFEHQQGLTTRKQSYLVHSK